MVKRNGEWYAHFVLKKTVEVPDEGKGGKPYLNGGSPQPLGVGASQNRLFESWAIMDGFAGYT